MRAAGGKRFILGIIQREVPKVCVVNNYLVPRERIVECRVEFGVEYRVECRVEYRVVTSI